MIQKSRKRKKKMYLELGTTSRLTVPGGGGGWSGGAMVLGKLPVPGRPTIWVKVGQGPIALAEGAGGGLFGHFFLLYLFFSFSLSGVVGWCEGAG